MFALHNYKSQITSIMLILCVSALFLLIFSIKGKVNADSNNINAFAPTLGVYTNTSVNLGGNTFITPDAAPVSATSATAFTTSDFKGRLTVDPATGVVTVTNANPAGIYNVNVTAYESGGTVTKIFTLTVATPRVCSPTGFNSGVTYSTGAGTMPVGIALGDFNGDGKQDLVTANFNNPANTVSVFLRNSANTGFDANVEYAVGAAYPVSVDVADFNGDGRADIVTANLGNSISVLLRNGANTGFDTALTYAGVNQPNRVRTGDFNGDGRADIVTANALAFPTATTTISVFLRNAANTGFNTHVEYNVAGRPTSVAVADFNGDGKQDIAAATSITGNNVSVLLRNSANTGFDSHVDYTVGVSPNSIGAGDFNGDGKQDIVVGSFSNDVSVLLRNSTNTGFESSVEYPTTMGFGIFSVEAADINGDGKQDIVTSSNSTFVSVLLRKSDNTGFETAVNFSSGGSNSREAIVGDFDGDKKTDIASAHQGTPLMAVMMGNCTITNSPPTITAASGLTRQQGSPVSNSQIANVNDAGSGASGVTVTVNGSSSATVNGVTVSNIVNTNGNITANIIADCTASNASFTLTASDDIDSTNATLNITVVANTAPALSYSNPNDVSFGGSLTINPTSGPGDNGSVSSITVESQGTYTGNISVDGSGIVSISNAAPVGSHTIIIRATDNCGAFTDATFTLNVKSDTTINITNVSSNISSRNQAVTVQWTVAPVVGGGPPLTGDVTVMYGVDYCTALVSNGQCNITLTTAGARNLIAVYEGDAIYFSSSSAGVAHAVKSLTPVDFDGDWISDYAVVTTSVSSSRFVKEETDERTDLKVIGGDILARERQRIWTESYDKLMMIRSGRGFVELPKDVQDTVEARKTESWINRAVNEVDAGMLWMIKRSSDGSTLTYTLGSADDVFVPADYDGDGKCDAAVWTPSTATFTVINSSDSSTATYTLGNSSSDPTVTGDYDGDGHSDPAVFDSSTGLWSYLGGTNHDALQTQVWMQNGIPAPGDYNGDGKYDFAVQLPPTSAPDAGKFRIAFNDENIGPTADIAVTYGLAIYAIVPGDYDGDGKTDIAQANLSETNIGWRVLTSLSNYTAQVKTTFGVIATDRTVQGDYDGDGKIDRAIYSAGATPDDGVFKVLMSGKPGTTAIDWGNVNDYSIAFFNTH